jgi:hypothetical protein
VLLGLEEMREAQVRGTGTGTGTGGGRCRGGGRGGGGGGGRETCRGRGRGRLLVGYWLTANPNNPNPNPKAREARGPERSAAPGGAGRADLGPAASDRAEQARNQRQRVERARTAAAGRGALLTPPASARHRPSCNTPLAPSSPGTADDEGGGATPLPAVTPGARWDGTHWYVGRTRPKSGLSQHANAAYRV